uniref:alpha-N-acetylgalactosaminide alpha-2,6-sialyltransferase n=1 Tax=Fundulus heteroclitus TaxID=8078 RepID=A0A3Q2PI47_FUNHE
MALKRQLLVAVSVVCLLVVYMLYVKMQWPPSLYLLDIRKAQAVASRPNSIAEDSTPRDSDLSQRDGTSTPPNPTAAKKTAALKTQPFTNPPKPAQNQILNAFSSKSEGEDEAKKSTKALPAKPTKPPGPTDPPYIGDSYMTEEFPSQTNCLDGIRNRIKESEFGSRFLERIPVLQWARHATEEQHQRLKQYPGTHGWGGVDYDTLKDTLSVLNSSANWRMLDDWETRKNKSECSRCAVVGNGGILNGSKKGKEIDGHHYVFRTNGAVIQGFEEDVGSRTTHYTFSTNTLMNSMRSYGGAGYHGPPVSPETRYVFLPDHDRDYLLMKAAATHTPVERGPERGKEFLRSNILKGRYKDIYRPSTGAAMLLAALHTCDQVSAYGFMTPDYQKYSDHYYDKSYHKVAFYANHDMRMEMVVWQHLHDAGLITLYMRQ